MFTLTLNSSCSKKLQIILHNRTNYVQCNKSEIFVEQLFLFLHWHMHLPNSASCMQGVWAVQKLTFEVDLLVISYVHSYRSLLQIIQVIQALKGKK